MLTIFSIPKPFAGRIAEIQAAAIASWGQLVPEAQIVLVGDEPGVAEAATMAGATHIARVERSGHGTPRIDGAFARVAEIAEHPLCCFVNADVVLLDDLVPAVRAAAAPRFLLVGQTRDLAGVDRSELSTRDARVRLRGRACREGVLRGPAALDYFVFPSTLFDPMPPFLVGRACFDNWLIWKGRRQGPVIDATGAVVAIHQAHDYGHVAGGKNEAYYGPEAAENLRLAGGKHHLYTLYDASHKMRADRTVRRNWGAPLRWQETVRRTRAKARLVARNAAAARTR